MRRPAKSRFGSLNCRGLKDAMKKHQVAEDAHRYNIEMLAIQETHTTTNDVEILRTMNNKQSYILYHSGREGERRAGVGILVRKEAKSTFTPVSERLCMCTIQLTKPRRRITMICAYAPTLPNSEADPTKREEFYNQLESLIKTVGSSTTLLVAGDFNAQIGTAYWKYPNNMGPFGKGKLNSNGQELLELTARNDLLVTNTTFQHKLSHVTTWEAPTRKLIYRDGTKRINPFRNQIDFILARSKDRLRITDSRSYSGTTTYTDHRLVLTTMRITIKHKTKTFQKKIDLQKLKHPITRAKYAFTTEVHLRTLEDESETPDDPQTKWNNIVEANNFAAKTELGFQGRKRSNNLEIEALSHKQKKLGREANATSSLETKIELQKKRNEVMNELRSRLAEEKHQRIIENIQEIESSKNDSQRMFKAIRAIQSTTTPTPLYIDTENGITADSQQQITIITNFFKEMFTHKDMAAIPNIPPTEMIRPFNKEEIQQAVRAMKNNKSTGVDGILAEQIKHGPDIVHQDIAEIFNTIAKTGTYPKEVKMGDLVPLQKPGKKRGPVGNLRPIVLLSTIRKILAICLIRRIGDKIDQNIPHTQAAYRHGRSTTEQVCAIKMLAEKAVTSIDYTAQILLMDMSKAFDTIHRDRVITDLQGILEPDELHLVKILIEDVQITVKTNNTKGKPFITNIGTPQGDCLSPTLFTLYLAKTLKEGEPKMPDTLIYDHSYYLTHEHLISRAETDHTYSKHPGRGFMTELQYADDISWITGNFDSGTSYMKKVIPDRLKNRNLTINTSKTEEYTINHANRNSSWKTCRYLGTLLDTESDIQRRKRLALAAFTKLKPALRDRKLQLKLKIRIFDALVSSIFLYNAELWTLTSTLNKSIDTFQRKLLRWTMNIRYPQTMTNEEVYRKTDLTKWSEVIQTRRLRWFGHMARLPPRTPIRRVLDEALYTETKKPRGGQRTTWLKLVTRDLADVGVTLEQALDMAEDRCEWRGLIGEINRGRANAAVSHLNSE